MYTFELIDEGSDGHLIIESDGERILIDTGSPISFGKETSLAFCGKSYPVHLEVRSVSVESINRCLNIGIDALMGNDILSEFHIVVEHGQCGRVMHFSREEPDFDGHHIDMPSIKSALGVPYISVDIDGKSYKLIFDTGAHIGYLTDQAFDGVRPAGEQRDFSPLASEDWTTETNNMPVQLAERTTELVFGKVSRLPADISPTKLPDINGIIGAELLEYFDVCFSLSEEKLLLRSRAGDIRNPDEVQTDSNGRYCVNTRRTDSNPADVEDINVEIIRRLREVEEQENVRILMAIESGSRAWGFASRDSDYDVRFIYSREQDWYLAIDFEEKRDVLEFDITDDIDLSGWDVRKALRLFRKSNPAFAEWIQSPITYIDSGCFRSSALKLLPDIYSLGSGMYHYRSAAKKTYRGSLCAEQVPLKKYFYALRPLLAVKWLETRKCVAPMEFNRLLEQVEDKALMRAIEELLEKKKTAEEKALAPAIPVLNRFIESELSRLESLPLTKSVRKSSIWQLNNLFLEILNEHDAWKLTSTDTARD